MALFNLNIKYFQIKFLGVVMSICLWAKLLVLSNISRVMQKLQSTELELYSVLSILQSLPQFMLHPSLTSIV